MNNDSIVKLELNKILAICSSYAVLSFARDEIVSLTPTGELNEVRARLALTSECDRLLFKLGVGKPEFFPDVTGELVRASKGSVLSCRELMDVNCLLRSARSAYNAISGADDDCVNGMKELAAKLCFDENLENDIADKIISDEQVSDHASEALYSIRLKIKALNEKIRASLSEYASGKDKEYLQEGIVTIRNDRYVVPVKSEYKSKVKGFIHDRSQSGATFFIEPEYIFNLNNELIALTIDEKEEVERILKALSARVGAMREKLEADVKVLTKMDVYFAMAEYGYSIKATCPRVNKRGVIDIIKGRHPLIDKDKVVPVSVSLGRKYSYLLLSGANTGGKTVTLKMVGLFCLMAECGLFIPAAAGSEVCAFSKVFCDVGDSQSIEESLSTFSSHMTNVVSICKEADCDSLVLIDELGGGTNPDEGQAIARAVCEHLVNLNSHGIVTTHFTALKEFAYSLKGMENAAMQFDGATLKPLYSIKIGLVGASNALAISRRLGMPADILNKAEEYLSDEGRAYDNILKRAEESRKAFDEARAEAEKSEREWRERSEEAGKNLAALEKERKSLAVSARAETRRIVGERAARAEELLAEMEEIFEKEEISQTDLIRARTLKNKLEDEAYILDGESVSVTEVPVDPDKLKVGEKVFVESLQSVGTVLSYNKIKGEAEVLCGNVKMHVKVSLLKYAPQPPREKSVNKKANKSLKNVKVNRKFAPSAPELEINVIGMTVEEALYEVENFLDKAIIDNLEQVKIIHGMGTGKLRSAIAQRLKGHRGVKEFRLGAYGEGESGVTIVTLK